MIEIHRLEVTIHPKGDIRTAACVVHALGKVKADVTLTVRHNKADTCF